MKIIFETDEEYMNFEGNTCPSDLGIPKYKCDRLCESCYIEAGIEIIKEYEEKENKND